MKKKISSAYYLIPIVYFCVILFFIYLQFSAKEEFNDKVGNLYISGISSGGSLIRGSEIAELKINFNGFELIFSKRRALIAGFSGGAKKKLRIQSYNTFVDGLEIQFSSNILIHFNLNGHPGDKIELIPIIPNKLGNLSSLSIPFHINKGHVEKLKGIPLLRLNNEMGVFYISLPAGSKVELENSRLVMNTVRFDGEPTILIERKNESDLEPFLYWFTRDLPGVEEEKYQRQVTLFLDKAYSRLKDLKLLESDLIEDVEAAGIAFLSEAAGRGEYRKALLSFSKHIRELIKYNPDAALPFRTSPYLGNLSAFLKEVQIQTPGRISRVTNFIRQSDRSVFLTPLLIRFILNHAPFSLVEEVIRLADSVDLETESITILCGVLDAYLEAARWVELTDTMTARIRDIINMRLLPAIIRTDKGIFLITSPEGIADAGESLKAGKLIIQAGRALTEPLLDSIGRNLILSIIRLADGRGFLPLQLEFQDSRLEYGPKVLAPEKIYTSVTDRRYTPVEYPLYRYLYPGTWLWTASQVDSIEINSIRYRFSLSFPQGEAHYIIIQGIRPFKSLVLHGILWNPDPGYYRYTDGWFYSESSQTLFLKLTHRKSKEDIIINYQ